MEPQLPSWNYWNTTWSDRPTLLTRANASDGYPYPLSPLSQDLVVTYQELGVRQFFTQTLGALSPSAAPVPYMWAVWGYVFLNADQLAELGDIMPGSSQQSIYEQYMGLSADPDFVDAGPGRVATLRSLLKAGPVGAAMLGSVRSAATRFDDQSTRIRSLRNADATTARELVRWATGLQHEMVDAWESLFIGPGIASATFELARKMVGWGVGDGSGSADLTNRLHVGLGGNESAEAGRQISELAACALQSELLVKELTSSGVGRGYTPGTFSPFDDRLKVFIDRFGSRTTNEFEVLQPTWRQDPHQVIASITREIERVAASAGPKSSEIRVAAERELRDRTPVWKRRIVDLVVGLSRSQMSLRENAKGPIALVFDEVRRLIETAAPILVAQGIIRSADDLAYLTWPEFKGVLGGAAAPVPGEIDRRMAELERCRAVTVPELLQIGPGWTAVVPDEEIVRRGLVPPVDDSSSLVLSGVAASSGAVTAVARVMADPDDDFEAGDILVAKTVDPGWTVAISVAGGIVLDLGGPLSHGAVVARELGIPCVVGVRWATNLIEDGAMVKVDGTAGEVHRNPSPSMK